MRRSLVFLIAGLTVLGAVSSAPAQIVLPGTQPGDLVNWPMLPPGDCKNCHGDYVAGLDYEPFDSWAGSMMANSARDPLFWAAVDIANQDEPGAGEFCIRCHSPRAWLAGRSSTPDGSGFLGTPDTPDNDYEGVDCHFCHRVYEGPGGTPYLENGQYFVDDGTPTTEPARRAQFQNAFAPHEWAYSEHHTKSEFCAVCHDLRNPLVNLLDETGTDTGMTFPEQVTYTEWTQSAFAAEGTECQDCHMPPVQANPAFACNSFNPPRPDVQGGDPAPMTRHDFVGANVFMMTVLKGEYGAALDREEAFDTSIATALASLQSAATLELTAPATAVDGDSIVVDVRVTNLTGHKLPTGYPEGRRMWIHLEATDAFGIPFFESGAYDDASATLTQDPQVMVYETIQGIHGQGPGFHLVQNNRIYKDTRIPPRGFMPDSETAPVGITYPVQPGGELAHWSDVQYTIPIPEGVAAPVQVSARLRYQTASKDYIEFLRDENTTGPDPQDPSPTADDRGQKMYDLWETYGKSAPIDMVDDAASVPVTVPPASVSSLTASPHHNRIRLDWDLPAESVDTVKVLKRVWDDYPEFGSVGSALPAPTDPASLDDALANGWVEVQDALTTSFEDTAFDDASRTMAHYAVFTVDDQGVASRPSPSTIARAVSYRVADVGEIGQPGVYDGLIDGTNDLPVFSLAYGSSQGSPGWNPECDFGPTHDGSSTGRPQPDDQVEFADLVLFALQFGTPDPAAKPMLASNGSVHLSIGPAVREDDGLVRVTVRSRGAGGGLKALRVVLDDTDLSGHILALEPGPALLAADATPFAAAVAGPDGLALDLALLGAGEVLDRDGILATLVLDSSTPLDARIPVVGVDARGVDGEPLDATTESTGPPTPGLDQVLQLSAAMPNPFNPRTRLELRMAEPGRAEVVVFDLSGRRVATLADREFEVGTHALIWTGTDDAGRGVSSGVYLARARGLGEIVTRRMVLIR